MFYESDTRGKQKDNNNNINYKRNTQLSHTLPALSPGAFPVDRIGPYRLRPLRQGKPECKWCRPWLTEQKPQEEHAGEVSQRPCKHLFDHDGLILVPALEARGALTG